MGNGNALLAFGTIINKWGTNNIMNPSNVDYKVMKNIRL